MLGVVLKGGGGGLKGVWAGEANSCSSHNSISDEISLAFRKTFLVGFYIFLYDFESKGPAVLAPSCPCPPPWRRRTCALQRSHTAGTCGKIRWYF